MAPHSSTLAWKIPWTQEPGGLQSMGSLRVRHDWGTSLSPFTFMHWRRKWQPTPVFLPGEIPGTGEPGGLPSMGSHRVGHDWSDLAAVAAVCLVSLWFVTVYTGSDTELWPSTFSSHGIGPCHCFQLFGQLCMNLNKGSIRHHLIIVSIGRLCQVICQNRNVIYPNYLSWSPLNKKKKSEKERKGEKKWGWLSWIAILVIMSGLLWLLHSFLNFYKPPI